ncbi:MAG: AAA family ATPase [Spirochaetaceae bacterium]|nr:AAA family ATPase [Spirochaetaceae bacterium]
MTLKKVQITNFQSIQDSTEFEIGDVTCLVGKNEAGKTALLKALYRLNPLVQEEGKFDPVDDYPRRTLPDYERDVEDGTREPATVVRATYALDPSDITAVVDGFGHKCLKSIKPQINLEKGYSNHLTASGLSVDEREVLIHFVEVAKLPQQIVDRVRCLASVKEIRKTLDEADIEDALSPYAEVLQKIDDGELDQHIFCSTLRDRIPKFLYFDEYYQISGQDNVDALMQRIQQQELKDSDHPLLGLIQLAGLKLNDLTNPSRTVRLLARLEAAANALTDRVLQHWSQNRHLRMKFDIRPAQPEDPTGMQSGLNIWGLVEDTEHGVSTGLGTRSRGFIWFFSFLAWYSKLRREQQNLILLLDEPGLSLHGKAQGDLLQYFEKELKPNHQLIYSTHSVFMVDSTNFDRIRIVQDLSIEKDADELPPESRGTKVITEVLDATEDSLFPLQGALGYEIYQTLFVGPNSLVVEGVSDLLYIQAITSVLQDQGREGLSSDWTITPVGGSDKVPTFVALLGAQTNLRIAVLIDKQKKDQQKIEDLYRRKLLKKKNVLTFADYVGGAEADIEDMFSPEFYVGLINGVYGSSIDVDDLTFDHPRIIHRVEELFSSRPLPEGGRFNHFRPARYLIDNIDTLSPRLGDEDLRRFESVFKALNALL